MLVVVVGMAWRYAQPGYEPCHKLINIGSTSDVRQSNDNRRFLQFSQAHNRQWHGGLSPCLSVCLSSLNLTTDSGMEVSVSVCLSVCLSVSVLSTSQQTVARRSQSLSVGLSVCLSSLNLTTDSGTEVSVSVCLPLCFSGYKQDLNLKSKINTQTLIFKFIDTLERMLNYFK